MMDERQVYGSGQGPDADASTRYQEGPTASSRLQNNDELSQVSREHQSKRTSEAFMDMASNIPEEMVKRDNHQETNPSMTQEEFQQQQPLNVQNSLNQTDKSRVNQGLNLGPKYLNALSQLDAITDTKAVSVQLPLSMKTVEMTAITGAEEQALKTASVAPESFLKKLNELLYNHTLFVDGARPTFNEYLGGIYPPDKSTLIWGLLSASYVVLPEMERLCDACEKPNIIKSVPKDLIHEDTFKRIWDKELPPAEYTVRQEVFDGYITFEFGIPTERDRVLITGMIHPETMKDNISKEGSVMSSLDMLVFFTRSITVGEPGSQTVLTDLTQDIYPFIRNLNPKIADGVRSTVDLTIFDDYMPDFYIESKCEHCGADQKAPVDPEITFFRKCLAL